MSDIDYIKDELRKIWEKINSIHDLANNKISENEKDALEAANKTKSALNEIKEIKSSIEGQLKNIQVLFDDSVKENETLKTSLENIKASIAEISELKVFGDSLKDDLTKSQQSITEKITKLNQIYSKNEETNEKYEELESIVEKASENANKIEALNNTVTQRKNKIDELYFEINGFVQKDEKTNEETKVKGLKDELTESYNELKKGLEETKIELNSSKEKLKDDITNLDKSNKQKSDEYYKKWNGEFTSLKTKIEGLLPNALTAGLSSAYSAKKNDEIKDKIEIDKAFKKSIWWMVIASLIPFLVSIKSMYDGDPLNVVILNLPRLVLAIIPLYIPLLWIAYSNNKKANLSKRLIEEYSHKEVLSNTYEGLSKQIASLGKSAVEKDLKLKLLYNILEVSSENPGKLISDYNKADHPLLDALDKSIKLSNAVERIEKIPGLSRLASKLTKKADDILEAENKKAEANL